MLISYYTCAHKLANLLGGGGGGVATLPTLKNLPKKVILPILQLQHEGSIYSLSYAGRLDNGMSPATCTI